MATILVRGLRQLFEFVEEEIAVVIDGRPFDDGAAALAVEMPGHDVGVVLEDGEHDLVALVDHQAAKALGHEIDGLGGVAGEDQLILGRRIEKTAHAFAGILEALGCRVGKEMQAAMDVGIFLGVALHDGIKHGLGLLRRGGVVEIDQGLAIDLAGRGWESRGGFFRRQARPLRCWLSHLLENFTSASLMPSWAIRSKASPTKAAMSSDLASAGGMPRDIR